MARPLRGKLLFFCGFPKQTHIFYIYIKCSVLDDEDLKIFGCTNIKGMNVFSFCFWRNEELKVNTWSLFRMAIINVIHKMPH